MDEITADFGERSCRISVGEGACTQLAAAIARCDGAERVAVVTEDGIPPEVVAEVEAVVSGAGLTPEILRFGGGEQSKTFSVVGGLLEELSAAGHHRSDPVVALGGGVTGDLAGFVAATYLRGVPLIQCPTTLLAMVDSSIGGKTGVNLPAGKNLVGAFYQPLAVIADTKWLRSLATREIRCGLAEIVKYGFISDESILGDLEGGMPSEVLLESLVVRSIRCKVTVVTSDERESAERVNLNFGHTLGHAIEVVSRHELAHGEAISVGMVFALELGRELKMLDIVDRGKDLLARLGLPVTVSGVSREAIDTAVGIDKKYLKGRRFVLLADLGTPTVVADPPQWAYESALTKVGIL